MAKPSTELETVLSDTIAALGFDYVGCEYFSSQREVVVRIYVEKRDASISIDECAAISRQIQAVLTVEKLLPSTFVLEVSSPGIERRLFRAEDYIRFVGQEAKIRVYQPVSEQRSFIGTIEAADLQDLTLNVQGQSMRFAMANIEKGRLIAKFKI